MPGVNGPETRYAKTIDGLAIAYQALGQGPVDLVYTEARISKWTPGGMSQGSEPFSASLDPSRA